MKSDIGGIILKSDIGGIILKSDIGGIILRVYYDDTAYPSII